MNNTLVVFGLIHLPQKYEVEKDVVMGIAVFMSFVSIVANGLLLLVYIFNEVAIRTAPVSEHLFAIRTAMLTHMRSEAMFNFSYGDGFLKVYSIRTVFVRGPYELPI